MQFQYLKRILTPVLFVIFFISTNIHAEPSVAMNAILKSKIDWITLYRTNLATSDNQSNTVLAKLPKGTVFFTLDDKPVNGKYMIFARGMALTGWINAQDVEILPFETRFQHYSSLMDAYITIAIDSGKLVCPFSGFDNVDPNTVQIQVTNTWNTMESKYQRKIIEDALDLWVGINDFDETKPYCLEFSYQEKIVATRCSDKSFIDRVRKKGNIAVLTSFFNT